MFCLELYSSSKGKHVALYTIVPPPTSCTQPSRTTGEKHNLSMYDSYYGRRHLKNQAQIARYLQLLFLQGRDYISRFKVAKKGACFISVTCAGSIFGA